MMKNNQNTQVQEAKGSAAGFSLKERVWWGVWACTMGEIIVKGVNEGPTEVELQNLWSCEGQRRQFAPFLLLVPNSAGCSLTEVVSCGNRAADGWCSRRPPLYPLPLTPTLPLSFGCGAVTADECLQCCSPPSLPSYSLSSAPIRSLIPWSSLHRDFFFCFYSPPLILFHLSFHFQIVFLFWFSNMLTFYTFLSTLSYLMLSTASRMDIPTLLLLVFPRAVLTGGLETSRACTGLRSPCRAMLQRSERQRDERGLMQTKGMWV